MVNADKFISFKNSKFIKIELILFISFFLLSLFVLSVLFTSVFSPNDPILD